jgi:hypothetical protein
MGYNLKEQIQITPSATDKFKHGLGGRVKKISYNIVAILKRYFEKAYRIL